MVSEENIKRIALSLPEAVRSGSAFEVGGRGFAWSYRQKIEGQKGRTLRMDVLAVRVAGAEDKAALIAADPETFFTDAHYAGYPAVLIRLARIEADELRDLLIDAWKARAAQKAIREFEAATAQGA